MTTARELALLDENQRLQARVAELETLLGQKLVKVIAWRDAEHQGRTAEEWYDSYTCLANAINNHLGQFCFDDDCAEEAIFEDAVRRVGHTLRLVQYDAELDAWVGTVNLGDLRGPIKEDAE